MFPEARIVWGAGASSFFPFWHRSALAETDIARWSAESMNRILGKSGVPKSEMDYLVAGSTIPWHMEFWGAPFLAQCAERRIPGIHVSQGCATGLKAVLVAGAQVKTGSDQVVGVLTFDRTSNSPAGVIPAMPTNRKTEVVSNVWDHFGFDPSTGGAMIATAGNAARKHKIERKVVDEIIQLRYQQYYDAMKSGILKDVLVPLEVLNRQGRSLGIIDSDLVTAKFTLEELGQMRELDTCVTPSGQTHPSDGMAFMLVASKEKTRELSPYPEIDIQFIAASETRALPSFMPEAPSLAVQELRQRTGLEMADMVVVNSHNPFALNDAIFSKLLKYEWSEMNRTGSPLNYGHPQAPTLTRVLLQGLAEAVSRGGGYVYWY